MVPDAVNPVEQLSVTDADPKAEATSPGVALQLSVEDAARVMTGACVSLINVTVCEAVAVLPQASVTVHVFVIENEQPLPVSVPTTPAAVSPVEQLSVTEAVPKAEAISVAVGLQFKVVGAVRAITGASVSLVNVRVCEAVPVLPQASVTVHVFVTETEQPVTTSGWMVPDAVNPVEQLSVTKAVPKAEAISVAVGLQFKVVGAVKLITGA